MNYPKLPPKFKEKWIAALRSGKYKQGVGLLYDKEEDEYCCLGVACRVKKIPIKTITNNVYILTDWKLSDAITGDRNFNGVVDLLCNMNDGEDGENCKSFKQIANWIEKNL